MVAIHPPPSGSSAAKRLSGVRSASGSQDSRGAQLGGAHNISERKGIEDALREKSRMDRDLAVVGRVQRGLLPDARAHMDGFEVAGWTRPATEAGGDYYDWFELPDGRLAVVLADAAGHGVGAALIAAVCRSYIRASLLDGTPLGAAMARVNQLLHRDVREGMFVTAAVGTLNTESSTMELYSAGQAPILHYLHTDERIEILSANDIPLGVLKDAGREASTLLRFAPGDLLLMTTDGFVDTMNSQHQRFGFARLLDAIFERRHASLDALIVGLHEEVFRFSGTMPQCDDVSLVALRCGRAALVSS